jgi:hypothetical protein
MCEHNLLHKENSLNLLPRMSLETQSVVFRIVKYQYFHESMYTKEH